MVGIFPRSMPVTLTRRGASTNCQVLGEEGMEVGWGLWTTFHVRVLHLCYGSNGWPARKWEVGGVDGLMVALLLAPPWLESGSFFFCRQTEGLRCDFGDWMRPTETVSDVSTSCEREQRGRHRRHSVVCNGDFICTLSFGWLYGSLKRSLGVRWHRWL